MGKGCGWKKNRPRRRRPCDRRPAAGRWSLIYISLLCFVCAASEALEDVALNTSPTYSSNAVCIRTQVCTWSNENTLWALPSEDKFFSVQSCQIGKEEEEIFSSEFMLKDFLFSGFFPAVLCARKRLPFSLIARRERERRSGKKGKRERKFITISSLKRKLSLFSKNNRIESFAERQKRWMLSSEVRSPASFRY